MLRICAICTNSSFAQHNQIFFHSFTFRPVMVIFHCWNLSIVIALFSVGEPWI